MDSQISLFDTTEITPESSMTNMTKNYDSFGCCSAYRECSHFQKCLKTDEHSTCCDYRKRLESKQNFYGESADGFDPATYKQFQEQIDNLSTPVRNILDNLLIYCFEYRRGDYRCIVRNQFIPKLTSVELFEFHPLESLFLEKCAYNSYLLPIFKRSPLYEWLEEERGKRRLYPEKKFENPKEFFLYWLNHDGAYVRNHLAEPYRLAVLPLKNVVYAEQIYHSALRSSSAHRIYSLSPLAADGILSPAAYKEEETLRIKMSPGYSSDEKKQQIAVLQQDNPSKHTELPFKRIPALNPFWQRKFVITGTLNGMSREEARFKIHLCAGKTSDDPINTMDVLILGRQEWSEFYGGIASHKIEKAVELQQANRNIEIISEDDFYEMLESVSKSYGNPYISPFFCKT